ncbi:thioredoxin-disulfide reductase [Natronorarus salvus]|uniref:thioredoxin-disulfide reductase n=1 Tax=Natronorarus salvus TaxID=3117733 RepID=UPI002F269718
MSETPHVEVYTADECPYCERAKELLDAKGVEYELLDVTGDEEAKEAMAERADGRKTVPEIFVDDELIGGYDELAELDESGELDALLGIESGGGEHRRMIVAGSGISGLTAAIYAGRANNDPLVIEGGEPGGQLTLTTDVANYPGFPEGISGPELIDRMKRQAKRFGAEVEHGVIENVDASSRPFRVELRDGTIYTTDALVVASGASARTLGVPGEDELMGYGVSTCATCDGAFFRDEEMVVVGGGDAACEEASFLTKFAEKVYLVHRREEFRAEGYWVDRIEEKVEAGEIELVLNSEVTEIHGSPEAGVESVSLVRHPDGHPTAKPDDPATEEFDLDVAAFFVAIGHTPNTDFLEGTGVEMDSEGYIKARDGTGGGQTRTDVEGIFAAGDVVDFHYQQAITAGGMGCKAAIDADEYLDDLDRAVGESPEPALAESDD